MYKKGAIILIPFPFTDLSSSKVRPALIISNSTQGDDVIAIFISSSVKKENFFHDVMIKKSDENFPQTGLKTSSTIKVNKIATLEKKIILGELGCLDIKTIDKIDKILLKIFGIK